MNQRRLKLVNDVKKEFKVTSIRPNLQKYTPISQRLPIYYRGATPPRPDPGHLASNLAGVAKRVATSTPKPNRKLRREFTRYVALWLRRNYRPLETDEVLDVESWLKEAPYSEARKTELRRVWTDCGGKPTKKMLAVVKSFIKDESYPEYKFPRGIYSRSDAAKCLFGPLVQSVSKRLFSMHWFIKKIPVADRPVAIYDKLYKPGSRYIYTDYTSFEAHFTADLMECCENQLFKHATSKLGGDPGAIASLMAATKTGIQNIIFKTFNVKMEAGRMSGEVDTSASNGFTNLMLYLFASYKAGCPEAKVTGFVEGDDGIFRNDGPFPTEKVFEELGMTIKIGLTDKLERASFCGQVYDIEDKIVVTDIKEQVCRLGWTNKKYVRAKDNVLLELLRAKGFSLAYQYNGCPILGVLGNKILELTSHVQIRKSIIDQMDFWERTKFDWALSSQVPQKVPGLSTRQLVEELYNISILDQQDIENKIGEMTNLGELPFQFTDLSPDWKHYYELYSASSLDEIPVWIPTDDLALLNQLLSRKAITRHQHAILFAGRGIG